MMFGMYLVAEDDHWMLAHHYEERLYEVGM
jgi:hypothetical protein